MQFRGENGVVRTANIMALASLMGLPQYGLPETSPGQPTLIPQIKECVEELYIEMIQELLSQNVMPKSISPCPLD